MWQNQMKATPISGHWRDYEETGDKCWPLLELCTWTQRWQQQREGWGLKWASTHTSMSWHHYTAPSNLIVFQTYGCIFLNHCLYIVVSLIILWYRKICKHRNGFFSPTDEDFHCLPVFSLQIKMNTMLVVYCQPCNDASPARNIQTAGDETHCYNRVYRYFPGCCFLPLDSQLF